MGNLRGTEVEAMGIEEKNTTISQHRGTWSMKMKQPPLG